MKSAPTESESKMTWQETNRGELVLGNAVLNAAYPASDGWHVEIDGDYITAASELEAAKAAAVAHPRFVPPVEVEGASYSGDPAASFQLGLIHEGEIQVPGDVVPGYPSWFTAPRFAKAAGHDLLARVPDAVGFDVVKVDRGHYRTVATEMRA